ncbi:MAG: hypothetical protein IT371_23645 [Deltaproteobacteria bacterium]|nr:hypothetical protein [Deltaproteobacteria bacterium]
MADLMSGVAATFLILAAIFMVEKAERSEHVETVLERQTRAQDEARQKIAELGAAIRALRRTHDSVQVDRGDPLLLTIVLRRAEFGFARGGCDVSERARDVLVKELPALLERVCTTAGEGYIQGIVLEGHTDATPYTRRDSVCGIPPSPSKCASTPDAECETLSFANNVRLSAARAQNLFFSLREQLQLYDRRALLKCLENWFVVSGRGPVEPIGTHDQNRRVVIKIRGRVKGGVSR